MARLSNMLGARELSADGNSMELPPPREFPKLAYRPTSKHPKGYVTKVVHSQAEEDALPKGWLTSREDIHALLDPIHKAAHVKPEDSEDFFDDEPKAAAVTAVATEAPVTKVKRARKPKAAAVTA